MLINVKRAVEHFWYFKHVQTTLSIFEPRLTLWCFNPLPKAKKGMRWIYQDDFLWAHVWSCMHMLSDFVALHCTSSLPCASCFFWSFCLKHMKHQQSSTKKHLSNRSIPSVNFPRSRHPPEPLGSLAPWPDLCWRGAARYTSYGQLLGAARRGDGDPHSDLATWRPGLRRGGLHHLRMNLEQLDQRPRNCQKRCLKYLFQKSSVWKCLKYFEIDISIKFHDFSILFISPLIWCNDCAATMSPWRMWIYSSWAKLQESFFDPQVNRCQRLSSFRTRLRSPLASLAAPQSLLNWRYEHCLTSVLRRTMSEQSNIRGIWGLAVSVTTPRHIDTIRQLWRLCMVPQTFRCRCGLGTRCTARLNKARFNQKRARYLQRTAQLQNCTVTVRHRKLLHISSHSLDQWDRSERMHD